MAVIIHPATGLPVGDPELSPFESASLPSPADIRRALEPLILSASGWRKVFAAPDSPGAEPSPRAPWAQGPSPAEGPDEDSLSPRVSSADLFLAGAMAATWYDYLAKKSGKADPAILLGIDSRPTGPALADAMIRVLLGLGAKPRYLFIVPAPEIMAYARRATALPPGHEERAEGFLYISASHNPPGHNGVKFGTGGGVLGGAPARELIEAFRAKTADPDFAKRLRYVQEDLAPRDIALVYSGVSAWKRRSVSAYTLFARQIVTGREEPAVQEAFFDELAAGAAQAGGVGIVAEINGSARSLTIDEDFLEGFGVKTRRLNSGPRDFRHRIVPEGDSLSDCSRALEAARAEDPSFVAGYVPDCDGDRGNLVIWDEAQSRARVLGAQEVFALACVAESAQLLREGRGGKAAIAVNDATSLRIEALGRSLGVEVRRAETGEANVVGLAEGLRAEGFRVRILGEGSNGGNITEPAEVRDPLATICALLKLLLLRGRPGQPGQKRDLADMGLFELWLERTGRAGTYRPDFGLQDILASLPVHTTTNAFEPEAMLKIQTLDHAALKARYSRLFLDAWTRDAPEFARRLGVVSWEARASQGQGERLVGEDFASSGKGGLRILFKDAEGRARAFVWMRGSGTEPVFRVMADVEGSRVEDEAWLLGWHRGLVLAADRLGA